MTRSGDGAAALCEYLGAICACATHGGRVCRAGECAAVVMDVSDWTDEMSTCVKHRFQGAEISVHASSASLTGFNVVVTLPPARRWWVAALGALLCAASVGAFALAWWAMLRSL